MESSRKFKEAYLTMDDEEEDGPVNSNAVETRLKVPPDKGNAKNKNLVNNKVPAKPKLDIQSPNDGTNR